MLLELPRITLHRFIGVKRRSFNKFHHTVLSIGSISSCCQSFRVLTTILMCNLNSEKLIILPNLLLRYRLLYLDCCKLFILHMIRIFFFIVLLLIFSFFLFLLVLYLLLLLLAILDILVILHVIERFYWILLTEPIWMHVIFLTICIYPVYVILLQKLLVMF